MPGLRYHPLGNAPDAVGCHKPFDALAVGFSFAMAKFPILWPSVVIGSVCFVLTAIAVMLGSKLSSKAARHSAKLSLFGAAVLFAIGLKVLYEHDVFQGLF